jgi:quinol monooxygenase YgiN
LTIEYIRYTVEDAARRDQLIAAYRTAIASLDAAPECLAYELAVCEEDSTSLILRIEWASTEAHLQGFRKGPNFAPFFTAIGGFVKEIAEMRHYTITIPSRVLEHP